jgi:hypothetical protein
MRSCLPKTLHAEKILTHNGNPASQVLPSSNTKQNDFPEVKTKEAEKNQRHHQNIQQ